MINNIVVSVVVYIIEIYRRRLCAGDCYHCYPLLDPLCMTVHLMALNKLHPVPTGSKDIYFN